MQVMKALQQQQMLQAAGGIKHNILGLRPHVQTWAAKLCTSPNEAAAMQTGRVLTMQDLLEHVHG